MNGSESAGRDAQGSVHPDVRRRAREWDVSGPHFAGWEMYRLKGSPANPDRLYASQSSGWFGQIIQRSDDGGKSWQAVGNKFVYDGTPGTHQWYDGTPHPWEFARVWHLEPSLTDPDTVYAGIQDAALFKSTDGGQTWQELSGLRTHSDRILLVAGRGRPVPPHGPSRPLQTGPDHRCDLRRRRVPLGRWRRDLEADQQGLRLEGIPDPNAEVGHCVHHVAMHPSRPDVLFMQKHWDVMRSDDAGDSWHEVSGNLPTDFGFADRRPRARAGNDLRRADQERL